MWGPGCALWFWLLGVDGGWESDVNFSVQAGWSHSPHNLLIPLHVASLHMERMSGPPRALGRGGEEDSPVSAGGQHEDRPGGRPGLPGKGALFSSRMPTHTHSPLLWSMWQWWR